MITGDNPLTAVHVAREVEIVDREALILDLAENAKHDAGAYPPLIFLRTLTLPRPRLAHGGRT